MFFSVREFSGWVHGKPSEWQIIDHVRLDRLNAKRAWIYVMLLLEDMRTLIAGSIIPDIRQDTLTKMDTGQMGMKTTCKPARTGTATGFISVHRFLVAEA